MDAEHADGPPRTPRSRSGERSASVGWALHRTAFTRRLAPTSPTSWARCTMTGFTLSVRPGDDASPGDRIWTCGTRCHSASTRTWEFAGRFDALRRLDS